MEAAFGYEFKDLKDYKVEGLEKVTEYDPFKELKVTFKGVNGEGTVELEESAEDKVGKILEYYVDEEDNLSNGDVITVELQTDADDLSERRCYICNADQ